MFNTSEIRAKKKKKSFGLDLEWDSWNKKKSEAPRVSQGLGFVLEGAVTPK